MVGLASTGYHRPRHAQPEPRGRPEGGKRGAFRRTCGVAFRLPRRITGETKAFYSGMRRSVTRLRAIRRPRFKGRPETKTRHKSQPLAALGRNHGAEKEERALTGNVV